MFATLMALALTQPVPGDPNAYPSLPQQSPRETPGEPQAAEGVSSRLERCLTVIRSDPAAALAASDKWLAEVASSDAAEAGHCKGLALAQLGRFDEAGAALIAARDATDPQNYAYRAVLGGMAGIAALARGDGGAALVLLGHARGEALAAADDTLGFGLQLDQVRAHMALLEFAQAEALLADARTARPDSAEVWLLSATLSRMQEQLPNAQTQIERAAALAPRDPQIGLEAGIVAGMAGREAAARESWRSVIAMAPASPEAAIAQDLLARMDTP